MNGSNLISEVYKTPDYSYENAHYFCDYVELLVLVSNSDFISSDDIYNIFLDDNKIKEAGSNGASKINDNWISRIDKWFLLLSMREKKFNDLYPFILEGNKISLNINLDNKRITYIFFLLSSTRKYIKDGNLLTTDFERISYEVLINYLPHFAQTFQFGKSNISYSKYTGHITKKIDTLAKDLKCETKYKPHFFASTNTGDGGLDIVAWIPFENDSNYGNIQVYLGQCATGKDWLDKQDDTQKFPHKYITFDGHINYIMFIPYDGRDINNEITEEGSMGNYLFFDRFRLLKMITDYSLIETLPSFSKVVQKIITYEEDII